MARYTQGEILKAKMLAQKVSAFQQLRVPPLSRTKAAVVLLAAVIYCALWQRARAFSRWSRDKQVCPCCEGTSRAKQTDPSAIRYPVCTLCDGHCEVTWKQVESYHWGQAALRYRLHARMSLAQAYYLCGLSPCTIMRHEQGLVPLDCWPSSLRDVADLQLDREAAGHVSTT